jgi:hypothetical protein
MEFNSTFKVLILGVMASILVGGFDMSEVFSDLVFAVIV